MGSWGERGECVELGGSRRSNSRRERERERRVSASRGGKETGRKLGGAMAIAGAESDINRCLRKINMLKVAIIF